MSNTYIKKAPPVIKIYLYSDSNKIDLSDIYTEVNIYASLDVMCNSGDVTIRENKTNAITQTPITGREFIEIEFTGQTGVYESYHRIFFIYAVSGLSEEKDMRTYTLLFTDAAGMANADTKISTVYEKKTEDIIQEMQKIMTNNNGKIYSQVLTNFNSDLLNFNTSDSYSVSTQNEIKTVVPMWKPLTLIEYYVSHAISSEQSASIKFSDCVFFQNRKGDYILSSYKKMFNTPYKTNYKINFGGTSTLEITRAINNIKSKEIEKYGIDKFNMSMLYNIQDRKLHGVYGSTVAIMDFARSCYVAYPLDVKTICASAMNYLGIQAKNTHLPLSQSCNPIYLYAVTNINTKGNAKTQEAWNNGKDRFEKFTRPGLMGFSITNFIKCNKIELEMNGASDIDIGIPVYINIAESKDSDGNTLAFKSIASMCTNTWVVSKYSHKFKPGEYFKTKIECFTPFLDY